MKISREDVVRVAELAHLGLSPEEIDTYRASLKVAADGAAPRATPAVAEDIVGTLETPEFQRQTRDFYAAVKAAGKPVEMLVGEGYNHFEMLETLANPYGLLGRAVLAQMGLAQR